MGGLPWSAIELRYNGGGIRLFARVNVFAAEERMVVKMKILQVSSLEKIFLHFDGRARQIAGLKAAQGETVS